MKVFYIKCWVATKPDVTYSRVLEWIRKKDEWNKLPPQILKQVAQARHNVQKGKQTTNLQTNTEAKTKKWQFVITCYTGGTTNRQCFFFPKRDKIKATKLTSRTLILWMRILYT